MIFPLCLSTILHPVFIYLSKMIFPLCLSTILHPVSVKDDFPIVPINDTAPRFYQRWFSLFTILHPVSQRRFSLFTILHTVSIKDYFPYSQYFTPCLSKMIFPIHNTSRRVYQRWFSLFTILHAVSIKDDVPLVPIQNTAPRACSKLHWTWCLVTTLHLMPGYWEDRVEMLQQWVAVAVCEAGPRKWN